MKKIYFFLIFCVCPFFISANETPKLTLSGQATLFKPADQMSFNVGVTTLGKEAENVLTENSQKMQRVIEALKEAGLTQSEFHTGQFTIHPTYTPHPKNPPPDWQPTINGYEATNILFIKTDQIKQIGTFIDAANRAGANKINDIQANLKDERKYWDEAIQQATKNALSDAQIMADAAQVKLIRLLSISLNDSQLKVPQPLTPMFFKARVSGVENTTIEAGNIEIQANVSVVYEIEKK